MQDNINRCYKILDKLDEISGSMEKIINRDTRKINMATTSYLQNSYEDISNLNVNYRPKVKVLEFQHQNRL